MLIVSILYMVILYRRPSPIQPMRGISSRFDRAVLKTVWNLGLPVALVRIEGGYGIQPRWSDVVRKGKMRGYVKRVIEPEEYQSLSTGSMTRLT